MKRGQEVAEIHQRYWVDGHQMDAEMGLERWRVLRHELSEHDS